MNLQRTMPFTTQSITTAARQQLQPGNTLRNKTALT